MNVKHESGSSAPRTVAVVGAGMVGIGTAIWLLRDGHRVIIVDAIGPAEGTSFGNAGMLANSSIVPVTVPGLLRKAPGMLFDPMGPLFLKWTYLPRLLPWLRRYLSHCTREEVERIANALAPLIGDSVDQHLAIARGTEAERFIEPAHYTHVYPDRETYLKDALGWRIRREHGFQIEEIGEDAIAALEPSLGPSCRFAVQVPGHAWIRDPGAYVKALCAHAQSQGAELRIARVEDFRIESGQLRGLLTDRGPIECDHAVVAAGAWSGGLSAKLGVRAELESERGYHLELLDATGGPRIPISLAAHKFVVTPMDGRLRLAGLVEFGGLRAGASNAPYRLLTAKVREAFPKLRWQAERRWMGHRPATADSLPLLGPVRGAAGVYMAFGHQHVGLTGGPKSGRIIADLIAGRRPNLDLSPYSPERFG
ncbi:MAG: FAD-dependent oxidoreductase [Gammaproteobacteria bacterium]|nr:FAD-dependent oxidoreductase [Gammaproteobacteria bacterium]